MDDNDNDNSGCEPESETFDQWFKDSSTPRVVFLAIFLVGLLAIVISYWTT